MRRQLFTTFSTSTPRIHLRSRPDQGEAAWPQPAGRIQHAADLSRLALRQRLQPVRPDLPRDHAGRERGARRPDQRLRGSMSATQAAAWCRSARSGKLQPMVGPEYVSHYNIYGSALINGVAGSGLQLGAGDRRDAAGGGRGAAGRFRLRMDRHHLSGAQGGLGRGHRLRARDRLRVPVPRGAVRELVDALHGDPGGAAGAVRRGAGAVAARHADRRLFADRLRHADRPGGQERHPDRRIRQAASARKDPASSRPRWRRGGCGCARS